MPGPAGTKGASKAARSNTTPAGSAAPRAVHTEPVRQLPITAPTRHANPVVLPFLENPTSTPSKLGLGRAADGCSDKAEFSVQCLALVLAPEPSVRVSEAEVCGRG